MSNEKPAERQSRAKPAGRGAEPIQGGRVDQAASGATSVLRAGGGRAILMTQDAYVLLLQVIHEHAPHILKYAFYDMGYRTGLEMMSSLVTPADGPEEAFRHFVRLYSESGYGEMQVSHFDIEAPEARLIGTNLFEAMAAGTAGIYRSPRCVDHYSRGMFAGFMSELLKREVVCEEIACQFRCDDHCEFVVLPFQT